MAPLFVITDAIKSIAAAAIDGLIEQLGKNCKLIYPPTTTPCINCIADPIGKKSSNRWRSGGPMEFPMGGICPLCHGAGKNVTENSEVVKMLLDFNPKEWWMDAKIGVESNLALRVADGYCRTKFFIKDLPKIRRCTEAILGMDMEGYLHARYQTMSEAQDRSNIVQGRYATVMWRRSG